jgi:hypothetical protein
MWLWGPKRGGDRLKNSHAFFSHAFFLEKLAKSEAFNGLKARKQGENQGGEERNRMLKDLENAGTHTSGYNWNSGSVKKSNERIGSAIERVMSGRDTQRSQRADTGSCWRSARGRKMLLLSDLQRARAKQRQAQREYLVLANESDGKASRER